MANSNSTQTAERALSNALTSASVTNYPAIFAGFAEKGITDVQPRVNVFTYDAWKALGRQVRRGEHGVKVTTWIPMTKKDDSAPEGEVSFRRPKSTTVFHVSQTDPVQQ